MVIEPGLQVQRLSTGMFSNCAVCFCFILYVRIPKGLKGQDVPSPHPAKLGLPVNAASLPGAEGSPLVLHLGNRTLSEWEWTEGQGLPRQVLLPAV